MKARLKYEADRQVLAHGNHGKICGGYAGSRNIVEPTKVMENNNAKYSRPHESCRVG